ncbi:arabinose transporter [Devosia sp. CN2-171]|uniref:arabinose transporter n=1 Tax=Devosia sp. CN2-171 TaxID=3400909 RepID=UPI003BF774D6
MSDRKQTTGSNSMGLLAHLAPILASVTVIFLTTGAALPALPLYIHDSLGFGVFVVGLVSGAQFAAALLSRLVAGTLSDTRGPKVAVVTGLFLAIVAALIYLLSLILVENPTASVAVLVAGRTVMGGAESFVITGAQSWGLAVAGPGNAGKVIGWIGTAMYIALAVGAPIGSLLFEAFGFAAIAVVTLGASTISLLAIVRVPSERRGPSRARRWKPVLRAVWLPGVGMMGASLGYGAMTAFSVLLFVQRGWEPAWLPFTAFAVALVVARVTFAGLPDRIGGAKTAMIFVIVQAAGMALIWLSPTPALGFFGALVTGLGYSFVFPGLGIEAVRRAPADSKGSAMAVYTAFIDVALGILTPLLGLLAGAYGLGAVFATSAVLALCTVPIAAHLRRSSDDVEPSEQVSPES